MTAAGGLFTTTAMADPFSPRAHVSQMIRFEAALARSAARAGVIPEATASSIAEACRVELYDADAIYSAAAIAGMPVIDEERPFWNAARKLREEAPGVR